MKILGSLAEYSLSVILSDEESERFWSAFCEREAITVPELGEGEFYVEQMATIRPLEYTAFLLSLKEKWTPEKANIRSKILAEMEA